MGQKWDALWDGLKQKSLNKVNYSGFFLHQTWLKRDYLFANFSLIRALRPDSSRK
jgi:hypothetical protein